MACRDIGAFRAEMDGACGDYKSAECHTMAREAMRRYGTGCIDQPIFGTNMPSFSAYLCTGSHSAQLSVCKGSSPRNNAVALAPTVPKVSSGGWRTVGAVGAVGAVGVVGVVGAVGVGSQKLAQRRHRQLEEQAQRTQLEERAQRKAKLYERLQDVRTGRQKLTP